MKNLKLIFVLMLLLTALTNCKKNEVINLTQQEKDDLIVLREEEKLARDVYLYSFDKYGDDIFSNIASSEQKHMDKILTLLNKYDLPDLASSQRGIFKNQTLQVLYNNLTLKADSSLIEALKVGATIEDLDINDIDDFINRTSVSDILKTYDKLNCGSRNHMRAFSGRLTSASVTYMPQYISQQEYNAIILNSNERCGGN